MTDQLRRRFLKLIPGAAAASVLPSTKKPKTPEFRFACDCGGQVIAPTPKEEGAKVNVICSGCKRKWHLTWRGDHFTVQV